MKTIILLLITVTSFSAFAADKCTTWGCISTIEELHTNANGDTYIGTPLDETSANCTLISSNRFTLKSDAVNAKEIYSSLLAAYMSDSKIQLRIIEGSAGCELAYVRLSKTF